MIRDELEQIREVLAKEIDICQKVIELEIIITIAVQSSRLELQDFFSNNASILPI